MIRPHGRRPGAALLPALAAAAIVMACAGSGGCSTPMTIEGRIERYPEQYDRLSEEDRARVRRGDIRRGMSKEGVFLAWGEPDFVENGSRRGVPLERWFYSEDVPVTWHGHAAWPLADPFYPGLYHDPHLAGGWISRPVARVEFLNGAVVSWERFP